MKKAIALTLVIVLCLSLVACGGKESKNPVVGTWRYEKGQVDLVIKADKTGSMSKGDDKIEFTWKFSAESNLLLLTASNGEVEEVNYFEDDDTLYAEGWTFTRVK